MAFLHKIKAKLYDNPLTEDPSDFVARVVSENSLSLGDICESAVKRGGADMNASAMAHAADLIFTEIGYRLCDGFAVNTGWFNIHPVIKGLFHSAAEHFNPKSHSVSFNLHIGGLLRKQLAMAEVEIIGVGEAAIHIAEARDADSGTINDKATPGEGFTVLGSKLKVEGDRAGICFINADTHERTAVLFKKILVNKPGMLVFTVPDLPSGAYKLEIATQHSGSQHLLKEPRTAAFEHLLTVL